jgi:hypothetical protein
VDLDAPWAVAAILIRLSDVSGWILRSVVGMVDLIGLASVGTPILIALRTALL